MRKKNVYGWMIAGSMIGGLGAYILQNSNMSGKKLKRKVKAKTAKVANTVSREAGEMLSMVGHSLTNRFH